MTVPVESQEKILDFVGKRLTETLGNVGQMAYVLCVELNDGKLSVLSNMNNEGIFTMLKELSDNAEKGNLLEGDGTTPVTSTAEIKEALQ